MLSDNRIEAQRESTNQRTSSEHHFENQSKRRKLNTILTLKALSVYSKYDFGTIPVLPFDSHSIHFSETSFKQITCSPLYTVISRIERAFPSSTYLGKSTSVSSTVILFWDSKIHSLWIHVIMKYGNRLKYIHQRISSTCELFNMTFWHTFRYNIYYSDLLILNKITKKSPCSEKTKFLMPKCLILSYSLFCESNSVITLILFEFIRLFVK